MYVSVCVCAYLGPTSILIRTRYLLCYSTLDATYPGTDLPTYGKTASGGVHNPSQDVTLEYESRGSDPTSSNLHCTRKKKKDGG